MTDRAPFDPADPFDAMAERFRREVSQLALDALKTTIYREMSSIDQVRAFSAGVLTGLVGVCFSHLHPDGRDAIMEFLARSLPLARQVAEEIKQHGGSPK